MGQLAAAILTFLSPPLPFLSFHHCPQQFKDPHHHPRALVMRGKWSRAPSSSGSGACGPGSESQCHPWMAVRLSLLIPEIGLIITISPSEACCEDRIRWKMWRIWNNSDLVLPFDGSYLVPPKCVCPLSLCYHACPHSAFTMRRPFLLLGAL